MKQFVKIGALALLIACSAHTGKGSVIKNAQKSNMLAEAQESQPISVRPPLEASPSTLGAGVLRSTGLSAVASTLQETNQYNDNRCNAKSCANKVSDGCESSAAYGVGTRKRTVMLEGDITYRNIRRAAEKGVAAQNKEACEEAITTTTTALQAAEQPAECIRVTVCTPNSE